MAIAPSVGAGQPPGWRVAAVFEGLFQPMHLVLVLGIALLVFGPKKLPELGRGLGASIRGFKQALVDEEPTDQKKLE
jgi:sec-independent protein translocase protein TatA